MINKIERHFVKNSTIICSYIDVFIYGTIKVQFSSAATAANFLQTFENQIN